MGQRKTYTDQRIETLTQKLGEVEQLCRGKACVYATGSYGRGEAGEQSDLDLFIVGGPPPPADGGTRRLLSKLDEICVKAHLIAASRALGLPDFSADGEYLAFYTADELVGRLGTQHDDSLNTFTARLLLLLESRCLVEKDIYSGVVDHVLEPYWRDFPGHEGDFVPAFLANDILRLWRTLCVNYEARTKQEPIEEKAKRRLKNYKLKHSRLLTCFSAILMLLAVHSKRGTVTPSDAREMVRTTPTERLGWIADLLPESGGACDAVTTAYEQFLAATANPEAELLAAFRAAAAPVLIGGPEGAESLGKAVFEAISAVGGGSRFHRLLLV